MGALALEKAKDYAKKITDALGGYGIFGVEMFVRGDEVLFSEVSPRPHDTGMVTMISQNLSEFALHARAILRDTDSRNRALRAVGEQGGGCGEELRNARVLRARQSFVAAEYRPCGYFPNRAWRAGTGAWPCFSRVRTPLSAPDAVTAEMLADFEIKTF